ncbi:MAG TPA: hypothetical protein VFQ45_06765 [Longimicrobium sp.]|nr:hypothetical protein [Longimicrobium sp.]
MDAGRGGRLGRGTRLAVALAALAACGPPRAELAGELDGLPPRSTAFANGTAWVAGAESGMLHAVRIAGDGRPREAGRIPVPGRVDAMAAAGGRLLLAITADSAALMAPTAREWLARGWLPGALSLVLLDVAGPRPRVTGTAAVPVGASTGARQVVLDGARAFVVTDRGVWLADVSGPAPRVLARIAPRGAAVAAAGRHVYVAEGAADAGPGGVAVLEVAADGAVRELGRLDARALGEPEDGAVLAAAVSAVAAAGGRVYLGVRVDGRQRPRRALVAVDVHDPARPQVAARVELDYVDGIVARGERLYAYGSGNSRALLGVFDVSRPGPPREVGTYDVDELTDISAIGALHVAGRHLVLHSAGRGITVLRIPH